MTFEEAQERAKISSAMSQLATRALRHAKQVGRFSTGGALRGGLVGSGAGAALGAGSALAQGEDLGTAARRGIAGGVAGGALGAAGGAAGRAVRDTKLLDPSLSSGQAVAETAKRVGGHIKNFGRRQLHGFTGAGDPRSMGFRSGELAAKKQHVERLRYLDDVKHEGPSFKRFVSHKERMKDLAEEGARGDRAIEAGVTSIPGVVKGLAKNPKGTAKALWEETTGGSRLGAIGATAVPVAMTLPELAQGDESERGGLSRKQKLMRLGVGVGSGIATGGLPIIPALAADTLVDRAAHRALAGKEKK